MKSHLAKSTSLPTPERVRPQGPQPVPEQARAAGHHFGRVAVQAASVAPTSKGRALPAPVQQKMESAFGASFAGVRVHEGGQAPAIGAHAYTRGEHIHFAPGRYQPHSPMGQQLLGHELTHVVQQRLGRVAVPQGAGVPINADHGLEHEAETLGTRAAAGRGVRVAGHGGGAGARTATGGAAAAATGVQASTGGGGVVQAQGEHTKNKRPSNRGKHEKGLAAKKGQSSNAFFKAMKKKNSNITKHQADRLRKGKKR